jgi:hypothetical protein
VSSGDDRDLERYLRRDDALSHAYAALKAERPSPALDQAVLARARDAIKNAPRAGAARQRNWIAVTAIAATVLLSFGLVMRVALEPAAQMPAAPAQDATQALPSASAPSRPAAAGEDTSAEKKDGRTFASPPNAPAASAIEGQRPLIEEEIRAATEQVPETAEPAPPPGALGSQSSPPAPAASPALNELRKERQPAAQPMLQERAPSNGAAARSSPRAMKQSEAAAPRELDSATAASTAPATDQAEAKAEFYLEPEAWLAEIERLRAAGETEAAERELARFKTVYPDYFEKLKPQEQ